MGTASTSATEKHSRSTALDGLTIAVGLALLMTCLFVQFLRDWIEREGADLRQSDYTRPGLDAFVQSDRHHVRVFGLIALGFAALTAVLWLLWQYRVSRQLGGLTSRGLRLGPVGGLLAWAIPAVDLVAPALVHGDLMLASDPEETPGRAPARKPLFLVALWWILFLGSIAVVVVGFWVAPPPHAGTKRGWVHGDHLLAQWTWALIAAGIAAGALVLWISNRVARKEQRRMVGHQQEAWVGWRDGGAG